MMKLILIAVFSLVTTAACCQECPEYKTLIKEAKKLADESKFIDALNIYQSAQNYCSAKSPEVQEMIKKMFERINEMKEQYKIANNKAQALIKAFYFYDKKFALAYNRNGFYFIDTTGKEIKKLGTWKKAQQFDPLTGLARVEDSDNTMLLDTLGNAFTLNTNYDSSLVNECTVQWLSHKNIREFKRADFMSVLNFEDTKTLDLLEKLDNLIRFRRLVRGDSSKKELYALLKYSNHLTKDNKSLQWLDLRSNKFTSFQFKEDINFSGELKILQLGKNSIQKIASFDRMKKLEVLELNNNLLSDLPDSFGLLKKLQVADLSNNRFESLPGSIGQLENLRILNLNNNWLQYLPASLGGLKKLSLIGLAYNNDLDWKKSLETLKAIGKRIVLVQAPFNKDETFSKRSYGDMDEMFYYSENFSYSPDKLFIYVSPREFGKIVVDCNQFQLIRNERDCIFAACGISNIPDEIAALDSARSLNLSENFIKALNPGITKLQSLETLLLNGNELDALPDSMWKLPALQSLDLEKNRFKVFPIGLASLKNLKKLNLNNNSIAVIPPEFRNFPALYELTIKDNNLKNFPEAAIALPSLKYLDIANNDSMDFRHAGQMLTRLKRPVVFTFNGSVNKDRALYVNIDKKNQLLNVLNNIPDPRINIASLEEYDGDKSLDFSGLGINSLPPSIGIISNCEKLELADNKLTALPGELVKMKNLHALILANNQFNVVPAEIVTLSKLRLLSLRENNIKVLPEFLVKMPALTGLSIRYNPVDLQAAVNLLAKSPKQITFATENNPDFPGTDESKMVVRVDVKQYVELSKLALPANTDPILLDSVVDLDLSNQALTKIPQEIKDFRNLKNLDLTGNTFSAAEEQNIINMLPNCTVKFR